MICQELESFVNRLCSFLHQDWDYTCEWADWPDGDVTVRAKHEDDYEEDNLLEFGVRWLGEQIVGGYCADFVVIECQGGPVVFQCCPDAVAAWLCN